MGEYGYEKQGVGLKWFETESSSELANSGICDSHASLQVLVSKTRLRFDLTLSAKGNNSSQPWVLPNTNDINEAFYWH